MSNEMLFNDYAVFEMLALVNACHTAFSAISSVVTQVPVYICIFLFLHLLLLVWRIKFSQLFRHSNNWIGGAGSEVQFKEVERGNEKRKRRSFTVMIWHTFTWRRKNVGEENKKYWFVLEESIHSPHAIIRTKSEHVVVLMLTIYGLILFYPDFITFLVSFFFLWRHTSPWCVSPELLTFSTFSWHVQQFHFWPLRKIYAKRRRKPQYCCVIRCAGLCSYVPILCLRTPALSFSFLTRYSNRLSYLCRCRMYTKANSNNNCNSRRWCVFCICFDVIYPCLSHSFLVIMSILFTFHL